MAQFERRVSDNELKHRENFKHFYLEMTAIMPSCKKHDPSTISDAAHVHIEIRRRRLERRLNNGAFVLYTMAMDSKSNISISNEDTGSARQIVDDAGVTGRTRESMKSAIVAFLSMARISARSMAILIKSNNQLLSENATLRERLRFARIGRKVGEQ